MSFVQRYTVDAVLICVAASLVACAHKTPPVQPPPGSTYDFLQEGTLPPAPEVSPSPARRGIAASAEAPQGWRVQVFAGESEDVAQATRRQLQAAVPEMVYVDYVAPYYKVRVGDCADRDQCEQLKGRLQALGSASAWVVPSAIQP